MKHEYDLIAGGAAGVTAYSLKDRFSPIISFPLLFIGAELGLMALGYDTLLYGPAERTLDSGINNSQVHLVYVKPPKKPVVAATDWTPQPYKYRAAALG